MIEHLDNQVGELLNLLHEEGIEEDTLVLLCSDNGAHREGGHSPEFWNSTGPLKGIKRDSTRAAFAHLVLPDGLEP